MNYQKKKYQKSIFLSLWLFQNILFPWDMTGCRRVPQHPHFLPDNVKMFQEASFFIIDTWETSSGFCLKIPGLGITTRETRFKALAAEESTGRGRQLSSALTSRYEPHPSLLQCRCRLTEKRGLPQTCFSRAAEFSAFRNQRSWRAETGSRSPVAFAEATSRGRCCATDRAEVAAAPPRSNGSRCGAGAGAGNSVFGGSSGIP